MSARRSPDVARALYHCVRTVAGGRPIEDGDEAIDLAERACQRGLIRRLTRTARVPRYALTEAGKKWLPGAMVEVDAMRVEGALRYAPESTFPALTLELLSLLRHKDMVWQPRGIYERRHVGDQRDLLHPGAFASRFMVCSDAQRAPGKLVWWVGDGPNVARIGEQTYGALLRGELLGDGRMQIDGKTMELLFCGPLDGSRRLSAARLWNVDRTAFEPAVTDGSSAP